MIKFPEAAEREWSAAAVSVETGPSVREKIQREVEVANTLERMRITHEAKQRLQQELAAADTPTLEMMTLTDFRTNPALAPVDLIEGVVKRDGLTVVLGPSGSGKTSVALQLGHSLLTGDDFLGQKVTETSAAIGILSYDMDAAMMFSWVSGWGNVAGDRISVVNAYRQGNPMAVPSMRAQIVDAWRAAGIQTIIVDSFSASFFGHDQNDAAATMAHYRDLKKFALTEVGAASLFVIAHSAPGSASKARGSTVHHDTADTIVTVEKLDTGYRKIAMAKYREIAGPAATEQMSPRIVGGPDPVTHLVDMEYGQMTLAGYDLPAGVHFSPLPTTNETPDPDAEDGETDDEG